MIYSNAKVINTFSLKKTEGKFALEMEVEGNNLPRRIAGWRSVGDGSLRHNGVEYVSAKPTSIERLGSMITNFDNNCVKTDSELVNSTRTSVHMHINMQEEKLIDVVKGAVAYYMMEDSLLNYCGPERKVNAFCLPLSQARNQITALKYYSGVENLRFNNSSFKYTGLNLGAINKFGSIEQRSMRGVYDRDILIPWVKNINKIWEVAKEFDTPKDVLDYFYGREYKSFCGTFLEPEFLDTITSYHDWDESKGINNSQLGTFLYNHEFPTFTFDERSNTLVIKEIGTKGLVNALPALQARVERVLKRDIATPKYIRDYINTKYSFQKNVASNTYIDLETKMPISIGKLVGVLDNDLYKLELTFDGKTLRTIKNKGR